MPENENPNDDLCGEGLAATQDSSVDDPLDPDFPVEKLSLQDIDFEAGFWFEKFFPPLCIVAWIACASVSLVVFEMTSNAKYLLMLGGTVLVMFLSVIVAKVWVLTLPCTDFFLRVSLLWTRLFPRSGGIAYARLNDMRKLRKQMINAEKTTLEDGTE